MIQGPFYVFTDTHSPLAPAAGADWEQMMHLDILNFTGGDKRKIRGACLTAWGDAAKVDSGNTAYSLARYMAGMAINLWSPNGMCKTSATLFLKGFCLRQERKRTQGVTNVSNRDFVWRQEQ